MFIGRHPELTELNRLYDKEGFSFIVIYGRRRVGKTALISEFLKGKDNIFYVSIERNDRAALKDFSEKILERFPDASSILESFDSWDKALTYITKQAGKKRIVIAIDEYPYLAAGNPSISSILQKHIDTGLKSTNLFLILCGSSMSFMKNQILGYQSPLYGRRTAQFHIEPFDYYDAGKFFPDVSCEEKMLAYAVCGGIPQYLNALTGYDTIMEAIYESFLKKSGVLYEEPENLLKQELREPAVYNTLIASIADGATRLNEISTKAGEDNKKCSKYLKTLLDLHIIRKEFPYSVKTERNGIYILCDNMFRFWYRFIPKNVTNIESGLGRQVLEERIMPALPTYVGHIFEDACREYMKRVNGTHALPFMFDSVGRWWGSNPISKTQEEIDIFADAGDKVIFGECKWSSSKIRYEVLTDLQRKGTLFKRYNEATYMLFSKCGFHNGLESDAARSGAILVDLEGIYFSTEDTRVSNM